MRAKSKQQGIIPKTSFSIPAFRKSLLTWYRQNKEPHFWRLLWEKYKDPYPVWVSEIMLQQTTLAAMAPVFENFLRKYKDLFALAAAEEQDVKKAVQGLGYYRRFAMLHKGAKSLVDQSQTVIRWPQSFDEWLKVSGVGSYTAAAISSITLNEPVPVVDGNVIRVLCRIYDIRKAANDPSLKTLFFDLGKQLISQESAGDFNQGLMELGQKICRPLSPKCESCPVQTYCLAFQRKSTDLAPAPKIQAERIDVHLRMHIIRKQSLFALWKRPIKARFLRNTYGFYTERLQEENFSHDGSARKALQNSTSLGKVRHSITKHKITAEVFHREWGSELVPIEDELQWYTREELKAHLISSLDMKAWKLCQVSLLFTA